MGFYHGTTRSIKEVRQEIAQHDYHLESNLLIGATNNDSIESTQKKWLLQSDTIFMQ
jgi:hypothetical protein